MKKSMATLELAQDTPLERSSVIALVQQAVGLKAVLGDPTDLKSNA